MPEAAWKKVESRLAALFGSSRQPLSGSNAGTGNSSDSLHPELHLEAKQREAFGVYTTWRKARSESGGKPVVLGLQKKNAKGLLLVVHQNDVADLIYDWLAARGADSKLLSKVEGIARKTP